MRWSSLSETPPYRPPPNSSLTAPLPCYRLKKQLRNKIANFHSLRQQEGSMAEAKNSDLSRKIAKGKYNYG